MSPRDDVCARIKGILIEVLELGIPAAQIGDDDPLFEDGLGVDSVEALTIVSAVEKGFGITIPDDEIGLPLFQDVGSLADVVEAQLAGGRSAR
jgi:acyl carrier protein